MSTRQAIPFVQFRLAIHPTESRLRPTLVLYSYFDETGTHAGSNAVSIFGLIGNETAWIDAEQKWSTRKDKDGIKTFHTFDCKTGRGEFSGPRWGRPRRERLMGDLAGIVGQSDLYNLGVTVLTKAWENIIDVGFKNRYLTPYHFCFENALFASLLWSEQFSNNEPIAVVFAQHDEYGELAGILAEALIKLQGLKNIASITFSTPEKMVPLQLADLEHVSAGLNRGIPLKL